MLGSLLGCLLGSLLGCLLASSLACLPDFLRSVGHTKPNAAHCFCAVAFQGGVAASAFLHWRFCIGVSASTLSCFPMLPHSLPCEELLPAASSRRVIRLPPGQGCKCPMGDKAVAWPDAAFRQITARTNPRSRQLWGTLARAVASI